MKIVTVCRGGHVRSVAAKFLLTYKYGHEVLACGWESNSKETLNMLFEWADRIIIMKDEFKKCLPAKHQHKALCYHVGADVYGNPFHPTLQHMIDSMINQHGEFVNKNEKLPNT